MGQAQGTGAGTLACIAPHVLVSPGLPRPPAHTHETVTSRELLKTSGVTSAGYLSVIFLHMDGAGNVHGVGAHPRLNYHLGVSL